MPTSPPSALLVAIPEAEPVVHEHRLHFDPVTERGVPARVTGVYPFVARDELGADVLGRVAAVAGAQEPFDPHGDDRGRRRPVVGGAPLPPRRVITPG